MIGLFRSIWLFLNFIRCIPHLLLFFTHRNREVIKADTRRWLKILNIIPLKCFYKWPPMGFLYLLAYYPEFRNLFYVRIGVLGYFLTIFCPGRSNLIINSGSIGEGLFIRHGLSAAIGPKSIGKNCQINPNVIITSGVTILDNVKVLSGAVILGGVTIGNNSTVGANATVMHDVPDNCTVLAARSKIIKWNNEHISSTGKDESLEKE